MLADLVQTQMVVTVALVAVLSYLSVALAFHYVVVVLDIQHQNGHPLVRVVMGVVLAVLVQDEMAVPVVLQQLVGIVVGSVTGVVAVAEQGEQAATVATVEQGEQEELAHLHLPVVMGVGVAVVLGHTYVKSTILNLFMLTPMVLMVVIVLTITSPQEGMVRQVKAVEGDLEDLPVVTAVAVM